MAPHIEDPLIQPGALILVTAANGYIASHICDQLLTYGYRVRGTVRSLAKSTWMNTLFAKRHPNASFSLVEIPDISVVSCYDEALKGVLAIIHTATLMTFDDSPETITKAVAMTLNILSAAEKANNDGESIKKFVLTGSSWSVVFPQPNVPAVLDTNTWNTTSGPMLQDANTPKEFRGLLTYVMAKLESEQAAFKWVDAHRECGFAFNTVSPATVFGPVLDPAAQPYPSTAGYVRNLLEGKQEYMFEWLEPQWYTDARDAGLLHVVAAVLDKVDGERIFGFAERYTWTGVRDVVERVTGLECQVKLRDKGVDMTTADAQSARARELMRRAGREQWVGFEESVTENIKSWYP